MLSSLEKHPSNHQLTRSVPAEAAFSWRIKRDARYFPSCQLLVYPDKEYSNHLIPIHHSSFE